LLEINPSKDFEKKTLDSPVKYKSVVVVFLRSMNLALEIFVGGLGKNKRKAKVVTEKTEGSG
jgi:hypothetical protein